MRGTELDDLNHFLSRLRVDNDIRRLHRQPSERIGVLFAHRLAGDRPIAEPGSEGLNHRMHGNLDYAGAAVWGLVAVYVKQSGWDVAGADVAAWVAVAIAVLLVIQSVWLRQKHPGGLLTNPARAD